MGININNDIDTYIGRMTRDGMKQFVKELLMASEAKEKQLLRKLQGKPAKNELADLDEEMHGKPNTPEVEDDDSGFDLAVDAESDDSDASAGSESDMKAKKKGKK